jgi:hypothetical protein
MTDWFFFSLPQLAPAGARVSMILRFRFAPHLPIVRRLSEVLLAQTKVRKLAPQSVCLKS